MLEQANTTPIVVTRECDVFKKIVLRVVRQHDLEKQKLLSATLFSHTLHVDIFIRVAITLLQLIQRFQVHEDLEVINNFMFFSISFRIQSV